MASARVPYIRAGDLQVTDAPALLGLRSLLQSDAQGAAGTWG